MSLPKKPPKKRTITLGADSKVVSEQETLAADMYAWGLNDIHNIIIALNKKDVGEQIAGGNEPTGIQVDGQWNKPLQLVEKKSVVIFSQGISMAALEGLKGVLISNIKSSTEAHTGQLSNPANWEFRLIRNGQRTPLPASGMVQLQQRDYIVLMPKLTYASAANMRVAGGSKSFNYRPTNANQRSAPAKVAKRNQKLGFMAMTARMARSMADFATFSVIVLNTKRFAIPGERRRYGTAFLRITPRRGTARR